jgi:hypothetical protein
LTPEPDPGFSVHHSLGDGAADHADCGREVNPDIVRAIRVRRATTRDTIIPNLTRAAMSDEPREDGTAGPLSGRELTVYLELGRVSERLAEAYRGAVGLASDVQRPNAVVLIGHLVRELLNALPRVVPDAPRPTRVEYDKKIQAISDAWPSTTDGTKSAPTDEVMVLFEELVQEHQASVSRREESLNLVTSLDPAHAQTVPWKVGDHWARLRKRAVTLAHSLQWAVDAGTPDSGEALAVVDELTATLHALLAPYFESMDVIDALLARTSVGPQEVSELEAALKTPRQFAYFFGRADARWLDPLRNAKYFEHPPELEDAGGGYVRTPGWPQGDYLVRMAPEAGDRVVKIAEQVTVGNNPQVARVLIAIALAVPEEGAARLAPAIAKWFRQPLALFVATPGAIQLVGRLAATGRIKAAAPLFASLVDASIEAQEAGQDWELREVLRLVDTVPTDAPTKLSGLIQDRLSKALNAMGDPAKYSASWLRVVGRDSVLWGERPGLLVNALYRSLMRTPRKSTEAAVRALLRDPQSLLNRVALAVVADHADCLGPVDEIIAEPARWDGYETRLEFRRLVRQRFVDASPEAQGLFLEYAQRAEEVFSYLTRLRQIQPDVDEDLEKRRWRTRLVGAFFDNLSPEWQSRLGPLVEGEPLTEERPEPEARFVSESRYSQADLAGLSAQELVALINGWKPDPENLWHSRAGLAEVIASAVAADVHHYLASLAQFVEGGLELTSTVARHVAQLVERDQSLDASVLADFIVTAWQSARLDDDRSPGKSEAITNLAWLIERLGISRRIRGGTVETGRIASVLGEILSDLATIDGLQIESAVADQDPWTTAMNSAGGRVILAAGPFVAALDESGGAAEAKAIEEGLAAVAEQRRSPVVYGAFGVIVPQIARTAAAALAWSERLFGSAVDADLSRVAFDGYLTRWSYLARLGSELVIAYETGVVDLEAGVARKAPMELGNHAIAADLLGLPEARSHDWVRRWYEAAPSELRSHATRLLAEAAKERDTDVRGRARDLLSWRVEVADPTVAHGELEEVSWIASDEADPADALSRVLLPAMRRSGGRVADGPGVAELAARQAEEQPGLAIEALRLLIDGDEYGVVSHLAEGQLRDCLAKLLRSDDAKIVDAARRIVNDLGAQGSEQFRDLL